MASQVAARFTTSSTHCSAEADLPTPSISTITCDKNRSDSENRQKAKTPMAVATVINTTITDVALPLLLSSVDDFSCCTVTTL